jgi:hypothetical protein
LEFGEPGASAGVRRFKWKYNLRLMLAVLLS